MALYRGVPGTGYLTPTQGVERFGSGQWTLDGAPSPGEVQATIAGASLTGRISRVARIVGGPLVGDGRRIAVLWTNPANYEIWTQLEPADQAGELITGGPPGQAGQYPAGMVPPPAPVAGTLPPPPQQPQGAPMGGPYPPGPSTGPPGAIWPTALGPLRWLSWEVAVWVQPPNPLPPPGWVQIGPAVGMVGVVGGQLGFWAPMRAQGQGAPQGAPQGGGGVLTGYPPGYIPPPPPAPATR